MAAASFIALLWALCLLGILQCGHANVEGLYCGEKNCYDILGSSRDATRGEIVKAYRAMARKWHPDMHRTKVAKEEAQTKFQEIANAYEILRDAESRENYDYMLDNPEEYYSHYYYYYRKRVAPKVDVRIVIAVSITVISAVQYFSAYQNYQTAIKYFSTVPKYRIQALEIAKKEGLINSKNSKRRNESREEIREEQERVISNIIEQKMDIKGSFERPRYTDVLWVQLVLLPWYLICYVAWAVRWLYLFTLLRRPYGDDEKLYLIRRHMKLSAGQWRTLEEDDKDEYFDLELWKPNAFKEWKRQQEEEQRVALADNNKHKQYRRYMKNSGPGRMTFED